MTINFVPVSFGLNDQPVGNFLKDARLLSRLPRPRHYESDFLHVLSYIYIHGAPSDELTTVM